LVAKDAGVEGLSFREMGITVTRRGPRVRGLWIYRGGLAQKGAGFRGFRFLQRNSG